MLDKDRNNPDISSVLEIILIVVTQSRHLDKAMNFGPFNFILNENVRLYKQLFYDRIKRDLKTAKIYKLSLIQF